MMKPRSVFAILKRKCRLSLCRTQIYIIYSQKYLILFKQTQVWALEFLFLIDSSYMNYNYTFKIQYLKIYVLRLTNKNSRLVPIQQIWSQ